MSRYFDQDTTLDDLKKKVKAAILSNAQLRQYSDEGDFDYPVEELVDRFPLMYLTPKVEKDVLGKVEFDGENYGTENYDFSVSGFTTLPNGLHCCLLWAGGDWEYPVYYIIYHDGKDLRGYVPKKANLWNYMSKKAFGNDDEEDEKCILNHFSHLIDELKDSEGYIESYRLPEMEHKEIFGDDYEKLFFEDICNRIVVRN